jgi:hypothetical protein
MLGVLSSVRFTDADHGWVAGQGGTILTNGLSTSTKVTGPSSVKVNKTLTFAGTIAPAAAPGKVTIKKTRLVGSKWKLVGSAKVTVVGGSFAYSFEPKVKGKWRFVAAYPGGVAGTTFYRPSKSSIKRVKVK